MSKDGQSLSTEQIIRCSDKYRVANLQVPIPEKRSTMFGEVAVGSSYAISYDGGGENVVHKRSL